MTRGRTLEDLAAAGLVGDHPHDLRDHSMDWSAPALIAQRRGPARPLPIFVSRPRSTEEVTHLLEWANRTTTPVVPFGGGSGVCRAIEPVDAAVVDMRSMDKILEFDEKSRLVTVQAGIMGPILSEELESRGFMIGHEPQSLALSTVGGWIATRACGQLSARYGGIEDLLVGLEAVLPDGRIVRSRVAPRRATGPDVAALMLGSEGTLGIVTEATLRVSPIPEGRADAALTFDHMNEAVAACRALAQSDLRPTMARLYDKEDASIFLRHHEDPPEGPLLLLSFDGFVHDDRARAARELVGGRDADPSFVAHWWAHRNDAVEAYRSLMGGDGLLGPHALIDTIEVVATWSNLRALYHSVKEALASRADIAGCHLSHLYADGACLYFTAASACASDDDALELNRAWWDAAMSATLEAEGSISHHHGIGRTKAQWLPQELNGWFDVLAAVKRAVDPNGIMNPGALGL
ncbi:MAG: FAD-binding oxidoreductase [Actinomycetota bacterium]|nr:FAD-binding oxidoreductase [Actinomycetota bacterium]